MAQKIINIGAQPDDGTGDNARVGGIKINENFTELYARAENTRPTTWKEMWTGDWQPVPDSPLGDQIGTLRTILDQLKIDHPDMQLVKHVGDLVDKGTGPLGAPTLYGFPELYADLARLPIPLSRFFPIAGNHDRDATGIGQWPYAWTYHTFRLWFNKEFYYTQIGNHLTVFCGDMAGSISGEIMGYAFEWMKGVITNNPGLNILLVMHQPLSGVYYGLTEGSDPNAVQHNSQRIIDLLNSVDNVYAVIYGHVHSSIASVTRNETHYGTRHVNVAMGLPTSFGDDVDGAPVGTFDRIVSFANFTDGSNTVLVKRWNTTTRAYLTPGTYDLTLTMKYPAQLAPEFIYDGRINSDTKFDVYEGIQTVVRDTDSYRIDSGGGVWILPSVRIPVSRVILQERSNDNVPAGLGMYQEWYLPGGSGVGTPTATASYGGGMRMWLDRLAAGDNYFNAEYGIDLRINEDWSNVFRLRPSGYVAAGAHFPVGYTFTGARQDKIPSFSSSVDYAQNLDGVESGNFLAVSTGSAVPLRVQRRNHAANDFGKYRSILSYVNTVEAAGIIGRATAFDGDGNVTAARGAFGSFGTSVFWTSGIGSPEGIVTASVGAEYVQEDAPRYLNPKWTKKSGTGASGWVQGTAEEFISDYGAALPSTLGSIVEHTLATVTIPADVLGPNGYLSVRTLWSTPASNVNLKYGRVKLGSTTILRQALASTFTAQRQTFFQNRNSKTSQVWVDSTQASDFTTSAAARNTSLIDTSAAMTLTFTAETQVNTDQITLEYFHVTAHGRA